MAAIEGAKVFQIRDPKHLKWTMNLPGKRKWHEKKDKEPEEVFEEAYQDGAKVAAELTPEDQQQIIDAYQSPESQREIQERVGYKSYLPNWISNAVDTGITPLARRLPGAWGLAAGTTIDAGSAAYNLPSIWNPAEANDADIEAGINAGFDGNSAWTRKAVSEGGHPWSDALTKGLEGTAMSNAGPLMPALSSAAQLGVAAGNVFRNDKGEATPGTWIGGGATALGAGVGAHKLLAKSLGTGVGALSKLRGVAAAGSAAGNTAALVSDTSQALRDAPEGQTMNSFTQDLVDRASGYKTDGNPGALAQAGGAAAAALGSPGTFLNQQRAQLANAGVYGADLQRTVGNTAWTKQNTSQYPEVHAAYLDSYRKAFQPNDFEGDNPQGQYETYTDNLASMAAARASNQRWNQGQGVDARTQGPNAYERHLAAGSVPGVQAGTPAATAYQQVGRDIGGGMAWNPNGGFFSDPANQAPMARAATRQGFAIPTTPLPAMGSTAPAPKAAPVAPIAAPVARPQVWPSQTPAPAAPVAPSAVPAPK